ncbi:MULTISPECIES: copper homeostasis periplasmic binding protein CopC [Pantoea]|uniref:Copper resistance protein C n=1 Tax=Candidatus Pantoea gossypiicola TaxID=2608008 RepID=A0AB34CDZ6_9GAMM|nr:MULTISPECIES: copper homeostasis periplasmic binding protein CopC [Pantoea]KAA5924048.1 copper homeostasis periplasmic binding protein CopC [Pantoea sp. VH_8]KAA5930551.1 copper homeostasis periplasmic binding protein CopC [Pantoea sp. VH_4]KAA5981894.1 copper homeostasis periplasmic binding protein CopC [Pantoea sp. M_4]KAA6120350.1 copper homeostasis periplasmic binding protein CopC [Pantoea gossypiicola]
MQKKPISRRVIALAATGLMAFSSLAAAHAHLQSSAPAAKAQVTTSPDALTLNFSEDIEAAFSGVNLLDNAQKPVETTKARVEADQKNRLIVGLSHPLKAGSYQVNWHVLSVDGHKTAGSYRFSVK